MKQTAVEWLAEKYNYITWMRNRDEISAGTADEWRAKYLEQAKEMEKQQIENAYRIGSVNELTYGDNKAEQYYKQKYGGNK
jgi:catechol-2,3-dioxygenase